MPHRHLSRLLAVLAALVLVLAACGDDTDATTAAGGAPTTTAAPADDEHGDDHQGDEHDGEGEVHDHGSDLPAPEGATEVGGPEPRLIVADGAEGVVRVVDLTTEVELAVLEVAGPARVHGVGRHVLAVQRGDGRVDVIDGGSWAEPHGDHFHFYVAEPTLTELGFDAAEPTHVIDHQGAVAVFDDGDGSVVVLDGHRLGEDDAIVAEIDSGAPHHGVAIALEDLGVVLVSTPVEGEALPDGVAVVDLATGEELERFDGCPELHGEIATHDVVAFGCADGVLLVEPHDDHWHAHEVPAPADAPAEARTGTLVGGDSMPYVIGDLGREALVRIDLESETATTLPLPLPMASFAFDTEHEVILVVTGDGQVHRIDPMSGEILHSVAAVDAFELPQGHGGSPTPAITLAGDRAYLTDPAAGRVVELGIADELRVARELAVGGTPASVAVVGLASGHAH